MATARFNKPLKFEWLSGGCTQLNPAYWTFKCLKPLCIDVVFKNVAQSYHDLFLDM